MINPILEQSKDKYYDLAANYLATCNLLNSNITDWQKFKHHNHYFNNIQVKHKLKTSFWDKYHAALQKQLSKLGVAHLNKDQNAMRESRAE